jgi:hypothetical protein
MNKFFWKIATCGQKFRHYGGQIDALNSRAEELRKQNIELKEKVEKLSSSNLNLKNYNNKRMSFLP